MSMHANRSLASLRALHALADWESMEAALALAAVQDEQAQAQAEASRCEVRMQGWLSAHEQGMQANARLNPASLGVLSRQIHAAAESARVASAQVDEVKALVDQARDELAQRQNRVRGLDKAVQREQAVQQAAREAKAQNALDDLVMASRHVLQERQP